MSPQALVMRDTVRALREEFDRSFAQAPQAAEGLRESLLAIRVGAEAYALRLAEVKGLYVGRRILALPSSLPELLGVSGFRGQIVPVYDLAPLLGQDARGAPGRAAPRWLVQLQHSEPLALAFDAFDVHFSAGAGDLIADPAIAASPRHLRDAVRRGEAVLPILHLQSLIDDIQARTVPAARQRSKPT